jgi:ribose transport system ATP-binding protein
MSEPAALLSISGLSKRFGGIQALKDASFEVRGGEIHALLGANGAGKSTLIKILAGLYAPDAGTIRVEGKDLEGASRRRIAFVHQDLGLIDAFTVAENMALDYGFPLSGGLIDWASVRQRAKTSLARLGADIAVDAKVERLTRADKSIVAIARALAGKADIVVLDEPTASLPEADVSRLFDTLLRLKGTGAGVVLCPGAGAARGGAGRACDCDRSQQSAHRPCWTGIVESSRGRDRRSGRVAGRRP